MAVRVEDRIAAERDVARGLPSPLLCGPGTREGASTGARVAGAIELLEEFRAGGNPLAARKAYSILCGPGQRLEEFGPMDPRLRSGCEEARALLREYCEGRGELKAFSALSALESALGAGGRRERE
jgi:hypothetical protein